MAQLSFFNPSVFAPSAEVAVARTPAADYSPIAAAISDSMKSVRDTVQRKRDIDNLREETRQLAEYVAPQSQPLSIYLKNQADSYDLFTTNPATARESLLKNTLGFLGVENQRIRAMQDQNTQRFENQYKYRLTAASQEHDRLLRDRQRWESEQNDQYIASERNRMAAANKGIVTPEYQKKPYPYEDKIRAAESNLTRLSNLTPDDIQQMSVVSGGAGGLGNVNPFNRSSTSTNGGNNISNGQNTLDSTPAPFENPELPDNEAEVDTGLLEPGDYVPDGVAVGRAVNNSSPAPGTLRDTINEAVGSVPLTETPPASQPPSLFPQTAPLNQEVDATTRLALENQALFQEAERLAMDNVDQMIDRANRNQQYYDDPALLNEVTSKAESIKKQIASVPNKGSQGWQSRVNFILKGLSDDIAAIPKRTIAQEDKQQIERNSGTVMLKIAGDRQNGTIPAIRTLKDGKIRYLAENVQTGKMDEDVTARVVAGQLIPQTADFGLDPNNPVNIRPAAQNVIPATGATNTPATNTAIPTTNVMTPGTSMPSVIEQLRKKGTQ